MRFLRYCCILILSFSFSSSLFSQRRVDSRHLYHRVYAVVPLTGAGTYADPKRPVGVPAPSAMNPANRSGVIAWHYELTDDGKSAIVEMVFADKAAVTPALNALTAAGDVKTFVKGKDSKEDIERDFKARKSDFNLEKFAMRVPQ